MRKLILLLLTCSSVHAQWQASSQEYQRNKIVSFTHIPVLLLRVNPTTLLGYNNTLQVGAEIAPPFGKLSFAFDYGFGSGKYNINKFVRQDQGENKNRELKGEIRAYFSDWFPFYALDKKPFGRYYALEYINGTYDRILGTSGPSYGIPEDQWFTMHETQEKRHVVHLKFGRHIHLHRHFFLDVYGGVGAGHSSFKVGEDKVEGDMYNPVKLAFPADKSYGSPKGSRFFFSKTFGVRCVFPI
ncbi:hypothetical protein [Leadbetterella byssophila]|uniref:hypothetical protein n=1 Tax=Leadbetterella byssophila TaxID=316068 RepID=UPI0039A04B52